MMPPPQTSGERDDAPDPVLALHQLKAMVDVVKGDLVGNERIDVDLAVEVELDELGHLVTALDAAEGRAADPPPGDQVAGDDVERLAASGHAGDGAQAPAHARGLDRLAHDRDQAGGL